MRATSLVVLLACTRANPAYYPTDAAIEQPPPDAAVPTLALPDAAPPIPDVAPPMPDSEPAADAGALVFTDESVSVTVMPENPGGEDFDDPCGDGQVLVGILGSAGTALNGVNSVQARCADVVRAGKPTGFGTGAARTLEVHGTENSNRQDATCPPDQVVVGFEATTGQWIDQVYLYCAPVFVEQSGRLALFAVGKSTRLPVMLGQARPGPFTMVRCDEGKIAVGLRGASGWAVDWLGLRCARPALR